MRSPSSVISIFNSQVSRRAGNTPALFYVHVPRKRSGFPRQGLKPKGSTLMYGTVVQSRSENVGRLDTLNR